MAINEVLSMIASIVLEYKVVSPVQILDEISYNKTVLVTPIIPSLDFLHRRQQEADDESSSV